jgi:hypothetical protein
MFECKNIEIKSCNGISEVDADIMFEDLDSNFIQQITAYLKEHDVYKYAFDGIETIETLEMIISDLRNENNDLKYQRREHLSHLLEV